jgi:hypothetical protein
MLAPGRIYLDRPSVSFDSLKLTISPKGISSSFPIYFNRSADHVVRQGRRLSKQRVHGSSFTMDETK